MWGHVFCCEIGFKSSSVLKVSDSDLHKVVFIGHHKEGELIAGTIPPELWKQQSLHPQNPELGFTENQ